MGYWKVIIPSVATNFINNPNAMGSGNYLTVGGTVDLDTTKSFFGYRNYKVAGTADNQGIRLDLTPLPNAIHYATVRLWGAVPSAWDWSVDGTNFYAPALLEIDGAWYVYGLQFSAAQCNGATYFRIYKNGAASFTWYIGHIQVETGTVPTTPITGSVKGFTPDGYKWTGTPDGSSSIRQSWERSGGLVKDFEDDYKFKVMYGVGTGMPPIQHNVQPLALLPGALYQGHKVLPRVLDLFSAPKSNTIAGITLARSDFINAIKPDKVYPEQPVVIRYTGANINKPVEFRCIYDSGLEAQNTSGRIDKLTARFICYDPFAYETHTEGKELIRQITIPNANQVVRRNGLTGVWANMSSTFNSIVYCFTVGKDGCIYIGGNFTNVGDANGDCIVKWNPVTETLSSLGAGLAGTCFDLLTAPNGDVYAGGAFSSAGGVANTAWIAKWNGSTWVSLSTTSLGNTVRCLAWGLDGTLYVGGNFTNAGGVGNADYICRYTGTSWAAVGDVLGCNNAVEDIKIAPNGILYITGTFTAVNSITVNRIARYIGTPTAGTWSAMGSGLSDVGRSIAIPPNGNVYVSGDFITADGVTCNRIAMWYGVTFRPLGSGANAVVGRIRFDRDGMLWAGGFFTEMDGMSLTDRVAIWNGSTWHHAPINLPGTAYVYDMCFTDNGNIYLGYDTQGTAYASAITQVPVENTGSHSTYPKIGISRGDDGTGCLIKWVSNELTRQGLRMNYELQKGETLTIDLEQGNKSVVSSYYGQVLRAILRGSDFSKFCMLGGTNSISIFITEAGSPTMMCWIEYKTTHWAADTAI